jgi:hypothetical protein
MKLTVNGPTSAGFVAPPEVGPQHVHYVVGTLSGRTHGVFEFVRQSDGVLHFGLVDVKNRPEDANGMALHLARRRGAEPTDAHDPRRPLLLVASALAGVPGSGGCDLPRHENLTVESLVAFIDKLAERLRSSFKMARADKEELRALRADLAALGRVLRMAGDLAA